MQKLLFPANEALVIIDMQTGFTASKDIRTQQACIREIKRAKQRSYPIVVVEYAASGKTQPLLMQTIGDYTLVKKVNKNDDDGSSVICRLFKRQWKSVNALRICGVNAGACVYLTVRGLLWEKQFGQLIAVVDAINGQWQGPEVVYRTVNEYGIPIVFSHPRSYMKKYAA